MMRLRFLLAAVLVCGLSSTAHTEPSTTVRGKRAWTEALSEYDDGHNEAAIAKFEEAYSLYPHPNILFNLAQAYRAAGKLSEARSHLRTYLEKRPDAPNRTEVAAILVELDRLIAQEEAPKPDPPRTGEAPELTPSMDATASEEATHARDVRPRWYKRPVSWTLVGGGAAATVVGSILLLRASTLDDSSRDELDQGEARRLHERAQDFQLSGGITVGAGVALLGGGILKMLLDSRDSEPRTQLSLTQRSIVFSGTF